MILVTRAIVAVAAIFVALLIHEVGHVISGSIGGLRFRRLGVGPVCLERSDRIRLTWLPLRAWGPFAQLYPSAAAGVTRSLMWHVAGGPAASLIGAAGAWGVASLYGGVGRGFILATGLASACLFVATVQPFGTGAGIPSDGARLWQLVRGTLNARAAAALVVLEGQAADGVRPRQWDPSVVALAAQATAPPAYALAAATALYRVAIDRGETEAARRHIERMRTAYAATPRWLRADAAAELAFWAAFIERNAAEARQFLEDARGLFAEPHRVTRAEAAVSFAVDALDEAERHARRARAMLCEGSECVSGLDADLLDALCDQIERTRPTVAADSPAAAAVGRVGL